MEVSSKADLQNVHNYSADATMGGGLLAIVEGLEKPSEEEGLTGIHQRRRPPLLSQESFATGCRRSLMRWRWFALLPMVMVGFGSCSC